MDDQGRLTIRPALHFADRPLLFEPGEPIEPADEGGRAGREGPWRLLSIASPSLGEEMDLPDAADEITISFGADGRVTGFGGCSDHAATYALDDAGGLSITGMTTGDTSACDLALLTLQDDYLNFIESAIELDVEDDALVLTTMPLGAEVTFEEAAE